MKKPIAAFVLLVAVVGVGAACRPRPFPPSPPPAPGNVVLTAGDRSITATFSRPRTLLADYRLTCNAPKTYDILPQAPGWTSLYRYWDGEAVSVEGRTSPLVLSLTEARVNGITFSCTVQTVTRHGVSEPSLARQVTPVGPPRIAGVLPIRAESGAALVFVNTYLESDDFAGFSCAVDAPGMVEQSQQGCTFTTSGLDPDTDYTATVRPSTSHGAGVPVTFTFRTGA